MLLTPKLKKRNITEGTTASRYSQKLTERFTDQSSLNRSSAFSYGSNKSIEENTKITKMTISIKKKKMQPNSPHKNSPTIKVNPAKFRASNQNDMLDINSKMST